MNRFEFELKERGIIYNSSEFDTYDETSILVGTQNGFIITCHFSNVLEPLLYIHDKHFNLVASQSTGYDPEFFGIKAKNPWGVAVYDRLVVRCEL